MYIISSSVYLLEVEMNCPKLCYSFRVSYWRCQRSFQYQIDAILANSCSFLSHLRRFNGLRSSFLYIGMFLSQNSQTIVQNGYFLPWGFTNISCWTRPETSFSSISCNLGTTYPPLVLVITQIVLRKVSKTCLSASSLIILQITAPSTDSFRNRFQKTRTLEKNISSSM